MDWISKELLIWFSGFSFAFFVVSIMLVPWGVAKIPEDYFVREPAEDIRRSVRQIIVMVLKNLAGVILFVLGFIMFFIPGQGLLTMLLGVMIMNFPGKRKLIHFLVKKPNIQKVLNWVREKKNEPPLRFF